VDVAHSACPHHFYHVYVDTSIIVSCTGLFCVCKEECHRSRVNGTDGTLQLSTQTDGGKKEQAWQEGHPGQEGHPSSQDSSRPEEPFLS
jgi:hypothetical protein